MNIISPPEIPENFIKTYIDKIVGGVTQIINDEKNRYSHWDKIRYLPIPKNCKTIEEYWFFIKFSRKAQYKKLPFIENFVYILTDNFQQKIHEIDSKMHGSIEGQDFNQNKENFITSSLKEEAISSSQLEGAATTRAVAKKMLQTGEKPKDYSQQMIYNNYQAIKFIDTHKFDDLTPAIILELHKIITHNAIESPQDSGSLRQNNDIVVVNNKNGKTLHTPPDYKTLNDRIMLLCKFANGDSQYFIHPIIRAIITHFILAFDHPFIDGNGRLARLLFYWVALKNNYWLFQYITISKYIKDSPSNYYKSFLKVETDEFDSTYFIDSQLNYIDNSIKGLFAYIEKNKQKHQQAVKLLKNYLINKTINYRQMQLLQHAVKNSGKTYTIDNHKILHQIGYQAAREDLLKLAKLNLLHQSKQGRAFVFIVPNDLEQRIKNYDK